LAGPRTAGAPAGQPRAAAASGQGGDGLGLEAVLQAPPDRGERVVGEDTRPGQLPEAAGDGLAGQARLRDQVVEAEAAAVAAEERRQLRRRRLRRRPNRIRPGEQRQLVFERKGQPLRAVAEPGQPLAGHERVEPVRPVAGEAGGEDLRFPELHPRAPTHERVEPRPQRVGSVVVSE